MDRMIFRRVNCCSFRLAAVLVLVALAFPFCSRIAAAQATPGSVESSEARERLYREIAAEVAELEKKGNLLKKVVQLVKPTVVHIEAQKVAASSVGLSHRKAEEAGSGVIIKRNGSFYVLTNRHVIRDSALPQIKVRLADGRVLFPKRVLTDRATDVAIMEVAASGLVAARLGDSDGLEIGDFVLAVGSPFGLSHSVTYGIVSAKGRRDLKLGTGEVKYQDFLQTDAAINPGNSGGPLLNLRGEVVGINTAIASSSGGSEGIGFAIPVNMFMRVAAQLADRGSVVRAYLGVQLDRRFDAAKAVELGLPYLSGARVSGITDESPAEAANLQVGDVILEVDDVQVEDDDHLVNLVALKSVGEEVKLVVYRSGKSIVVKVRVGDRGKFERG
jgi:serine protease Do